MPPLPLRSPTRSSPLTSADRLFAARRGLAVPPLRGAAESNLVDRRVSRRGPRGHASDGADERRSPPTTSKCWRGFVVCSTTSSKSPRRPVRDDSPSVFSIFYEGRSRSSCRLVQLYSQDNVGPRRILSLFNIVSCNWNALGPAFVQSSDSVVEELLTLLSQPAMCRGDSMFPVKIALSRGGSGPHLILVPWALSSPQPKRHLDRFSCFCRAHDCNRPT